MNRIITCRAPRQSRRISVCRCMTRVVHICVLFLKLIAKIQRTTRLESLAQRQSESLQFASHARSSKPSSTPFRSAHRYMRIFMIFPSALLFQNLNNFVCRPGELMRDNRLSFSSMPQQLSPISFPVLQSTLPPSLSTKFLIPHHKFDYRKKGCATTSKNEIHLD